MTQPNIPIVLGEPAPVQVRIAATPTDAAGQSYPVLAFNSGAFTIELRLPIAGAEEIATGLGPALLQAVAEAKRRSTGLVIAQPGSQFPVPPNLRRNGNTGG